MGEMLTTAQCRELAESFAAHDYTVDAIVALIGEPAHRALGRNATVPADRELGDRDDALAILTRLWLLQQPVARGSVERALPGLAQTLINSGILGEQDSMINALIDIRPYASDDGASGWIFADLTPGLDSRTSPMRPDWVLGVSSASSTLAQLTVRTPVARALDLGTGCGVQSLHLARHADHVVATDVNSRALTLARLTSMINSVEIDLRYGSLYEPVADEQFELITSNPPYVMSPPSTEGSTLTYREGNLAADGLVARVITEGVDQLADGGLLQVLGNWAHVRGQDWADRLGGWIAGTGCDAHVVQREVLEPAEYVELWLADAGLLGAPDYRHRYAAWLDYFDRLGIESVGMGWFTLHKAGRRTPNLTIEHWPYPIEQPIGPSISARLTALDRDQDLSDDQLLAGRWSLADHVIEEAQGKPGAADPQHIIFRSQRGFRRAIEVDTALAGILGACDGELTLDQLIASVAQLIEVDATKLAPEVLGRIRTLIVDGFVG